MMHTSNRRWPLTSQGALDIALDRIKVLVHDLDAFQLGPALFQLVLAAVICQVYEPVIERKLCYSKGKARMHEVCLLFRQVPVINSSVQSCCCNAVLHLVDIVHQLLDFK